MKVVYLSPSGHIDGSGKVLLNIFANLRMSNPQYRPYLITGTDGPLVAQAREMGVPVRVLQFPAELNKSGDEGIYQISRLSLFKRFPGTRHNGFLYLHRLNELLRQVSPDVVHTFGLKMHLLGLWAKPTGTPIIWHVREYVSMRPLAACLMKQYIQGCTELIADSKSAADDLHKAVSVWPHIVYNGIDLNVYSPEGPVVDLDMLSNLTPSHKDTVRVGIFGAVVGWRGHEVFLKSISMLPDTMHLRAYVIGDNHHHAISGPGSISELKRVAVRFGIADRVGFPGYIRDVPSAIRACNIIVSAGSQPEPPTLSIIESMACGRPLVVSRAGIAAELLRAGENSLHYAPGDAAALAGCIRQLAVYPELQISLGASGRVAAVRRFDRNKLAYQLMPIYTRVTQKQFQVSSFKFQEEKQNSFLKLET